MLRVLAVVLATVVVTAVQPIPFILDEVCSESISTNGPNTVSIPEKQNNLWYLKFPLCSFGEIAKPTQPFVNGVKAQIFAWVNVTCPNTEQMYIFDLTNTSEKVNNVEKQIRNVSSHDPYLVGPLTSLWECVPSMDVLFTRCVKYATQPLVLVTNSSNFYNQLTASNYTCKKTSGTFNIMATNLSQSVQIQLEKQLEKRPAENYQLQLDLNLTPAIYQNKTKLLSTISAVLDTANATNTTINTVINGSVVFSTSSSTNITEVAESIRILLCPTTFVQCTVMWLSDSNGSRRLQTVNNTSTVTKTYTMEIVVIEDENGRLVNKIYSQMELLPSLLTVASNPAIKATIPAIIEVKLGLNAFVNTENVRETLISAITTAIENATNEIIKETDFTIVITPIVITPTVSPVRSPSPKSPSPTLQSPTIADKIPLTEASIWLSVGVIVGVIVGVTVAVVLLFVVATAAAGRGGSFGSGQR
tara:strand:+ start:107 stop:1528 length:1422 start_codon:yes stop_codon:yes gene_type:complete